MYFRAGDLLHWISALNPGIEPAEQRTHTRYASLFELQRHPGAGRLVGSCAVEDDVAIARNLDMAIFELLGRQPQSAGNLNRSGIQSSFVA